MRGLVICSLAVCGARDRVSRRAQDKLHRKERSYISVTFTFARDDSAIKVPMKTSRSGSLTALYPEVCSRLSAIPADAAGVIVGL
jgi:hypothetical protein